MIQNVWFEARSESDKGKLGVIFVTLNRVKSERFPDTICGVVFQPNQFSWTNDGISNNIRARTFSQKKKLKHIRWLTLYTLANLKYLDDPSLGSDHYHRLDVRPRWRRYMKNVTTIGLHTFYRSRHMQRVSF